jgi:hypothetical protein
MHRTATVYSTTEAKKPEIILYYNSTKAGVDQMDQMLSKYTTKRRTSRWPLAFFYNILDIAALAAYIIFTEHNPQVVHKTDRRRLFLKFVKMKGKEEKLVKVAAIATVLCVTSTLLQLLQFAIIANNFRKIFFFGVFIIYS